MASDRTRACGEQGEGEVIIGALKHRATMNRKGRSSPERLKLRHPNSAPFTFHPRGQLPFVGMRSVHAFCCAAAGVSSLPFTALLFSPPCSVVVLLCAVVVATVCQLANATASAADRQALVDLYDAATGASWTVVWPVETAESDPCEDLWHGVTCDASLTSITCVAAVRQIVRHARTHYHQQ